MASQNQEIFSRARLQIGNHGSLGPGLASVDKLPDHVKAAVPRFIYISLELFAALPKAFQHRRKLEDEYHKDEEEDAAAANGADDDDATEKGDTDGQSFKFFGKRI